MFSRPEYSLALFALRGAENSTMSTDEEVDPKLLPPTAVQISQKRTRQLFFSEHFMFETGGFSISVLKQWHFTWKHLVNS